MKKIISVLLLTAIILSLLPTFAFGAENTFYYTVASYSGPTVGEGMFIGTHQASESGNENCAPGIVGTTISETGGSIWKSRVGYLEFDVKRPKGELEQAYLRLYVSDVNENLTGWMRLAAYSTDGKPDTVALGKDSAATGYPAVNNNYSYEAAFWSEEIYPSSKNTWKEIDITAAVEAALKKEPEKEKVRLAFRLQVPKAGLNIALDSKNGPRVVIIDDAEEETNVEYTRTNLFTHDMLSDNPGEVGYTSRYENGEFLTQRGYNGRTFSLFEAAQYALLWDDYDKARGITLTEEEYLNNQSDTTIQQENTKKVFPYQSKEREWVKKKREEIIKAYTEVKEAGQKVYFMQDVIVLPVKLKNDRSDILTGGKIDIRLETTQTVMDYMYEEMFTGLLDKEGESLLDGIYIRYGETYTGESWGVPYHTGNNPILGDGTKTHLILMNYLRDKVCEELGGEIIYRTWGFGEFQYDLETYLEISNQLEVHENFYFAIKHTAGDFHRTFTFNQTLNAGKHNQIVEVQCAREYEGKGAYPNYIAGGVINGFPEYEFLMSEDEKQSLRDVINVEGSLVKGIWTWARGGGWAGPYINGTGHATDKSIPVPNGSEMWCDLNAYVINKWAKDTSVSDKALVLEYATNELGMNETDAESFYEICEKSSKAVLLGRARNTDKYNVDVWWTRDDGISTSKFRSNVKNAFNSSVEDIMLKEKAEAVTLWKEMNETAKGLDDSLYEVKLPDSETSVKEYIIMTTSYGYYLYSIYNQMHIAEVERLRAEKAGKSVTDEMMHAVLKYDMLWDNWQKEYEENKEKGYPTLYARESGSFKGYNSLVYCEPFSYTMGSFSRGGQNEITPSCIGVNIENAHYAADGNINTAAMAVFDNGEEYADKYIMFEFDGEEPINSIVIKKQKLTLAGNTTYWADHAYAAGCVLEGSNDGENWDMLYEMDKTPDGRDNEAEVAVKFEAPLNYRYIRYIRKEANSYIAWAENSGNKLILADIAFYAPDTENVWLSDVKKTEDSIMVTLDVFSENPVATVVCAYYKNDMLIKTVTKPVAKDETDYTMPLMKDATKTKVMLFNMKKLKPLCGVVIIE